MEIKVIGLLRRWKLPISPETLTGIELRIKIFTMPNRSTDTLFQLIKSLEKSEKRNFKLYVKRNSSAEDLKMTQLFDAIDKMDE